MSTTADNDTVLVAPAARTAAAGADTSQPPPDAPAPTALVELPSAGALGDPGAAVRSSAPTEPPSVGALGDAADGRGTRIEARRVSQHVGGRQIVHDVSLAIEPGELVAVAGSSGAGKTTLLQMLAGLRSPSAGEVTHDGVAADARTAPGSGIGYVPQDDIIHAELPLRRTLRYAAQLRLPAHVGQEQVDRLVDDTLRALDLDDRADVAVKALSGGQRKRASIAAELLTRPHCFFLDEPTASLDPATSAEVVRLLRRLTERGVTVVLTTHDPGVVERCDRVVLLARDGHLAFAGRPDEATGYFEVDDIATIYERLATDASPQTWADRFTATRPGAPASSSLAAAAPSSVPTAATTPVAPSLVPTDVAPAPRNPGPATPTLPSSKPGGPGPVRQWWLLTRRNADVLVRNRLTLAVLLGSPALVTLMMAMLFRPGAFASQRGSALGPTQTVFWIAFAGFFFGLTYGLLQIVGEIAVFRRERLAGLSVGAYVAAKVAVLLPVLAGVAIVLLGVLRGLDRLPPAGGDVYASLFVTLLVESAAALALGLLASALVADAAQAALALPMLCFPQVLFAGAIVPVDEMAWPGRVLSLGLANRHAFEALGRDLGLHGFTGTVPALAAYGDAFAGSPVPSWLVLAGFTGVCLVAVVLVLQRRARPA